MDNIHSNWGDEEAVAMALELSEPNQPYSCASWGGQFDDSEPLIVNGGSPYYHWWGMFEDTYVPANAFIDHKMRLHYKTNSLSYATANSKIKEMKYILSLLVATTFAVAKEVGVEVEEKVEVLEQLVTLLTDSANRKIRVTQIEEVIDNLY